MTIISTALECFIPTGTFCIAPVLLVLHLMKRKPAQIDLLRLTVLVNTCALVYSLLNVLSLIVFFVSAYYHSNDYRDYVLSPLAATWLPGEILLPQMLWFRRMRRSVYPTIVLALYQLLPYIWRYIQTHYFMDGMPSQLRVQLQKEVWPTVFTYAHFLEVIIYLGLLMILYKFRKPKRQGVPIPN